LDIKVGPLTGIDWSKLANMARVDPYLVWFDVSEMAGVPGKPFPVVVELKAPLTPAGAAYLQKFDVHVAEHYSRWQGRYISAHCLSEAGLHFLGLAAAGGSDPWVRRFELSLGLGNADAGILASRRAERRHDAKKVMGNLVGFVDYGCAFARRSFRYVGGKKSRVAALWDQQHEPALAPLVGRKLDWNPCDEFGYGVDVTGGAINDYMSDFISGADVDEETCYRGSEYEAIQRHITHGTHIMDVATGRPNPLMRHQPSKAGDAHDAAIVFVQLPRYVGGAQVSGLLRAQVLDALHYIAERMDDTGKGVINLSYGAYCGPHDGSSILECAMDELLGRFVSDGVSRLHLVVPAGNAVDQDTHAQVLLGTGQRETIGLETLPDDPSESFCELWIPDGARVRVRVTPPGGANSGWVEIGEARKLIRDGVPIAAIVAAEAVCQGEHGSMVLIAMAPTTLLHERVAAPYGEWQVEFENAGSQSVLVNGWCERSDPVFGTEGGPRQMCFTTHVERTGTLNGIAHGYLPLVVGGYLLHADDAMIDEGPVARYSGTGPGRDQSGRNRHPPDANGRTKSGPEVLAPSDVGFGDEGIDAGAVLSDDSVRLAGTSVAAAYVTRTIIENGFAVPDFRAPNFPIPGPPGVPQHPDDRLCLPRLPNGI
jgi:hypothetical protein